MPLNTLRLNHQPSTHPNDRIVFVKPLPRSASPSDRNDYASAALILPAAAAQCLPIMKTHHLSVTTLEEYEPNREFIGRNFNNGEVIQLVLKSHGGNWLPVNFVQMVMMHELAHNVHMNHSKNFWATRNQFAEEMRGLWAKGYTGDGLWGSGRKIGDELGRVMGGHITRSEELKDLPPCGGTFRSRGRKRKRRADGGSDHKELTWKEKRDRRIEKKFGKNGQSLGEDEDKRLRLDMEGKGPVGVKPRVAQSKRGRELRAAAALARFGSNKRELEALEAIKKEDDGDETEETEYEEGDDDLEDVKGADGMRLLDSKGCGMVRVCGDERDEDDIQVKREADELEGLGFDPTVYAERPSESPSADDITDDIKSDIVSIGRRHEISRNNPLKSLYDIPHHGDRLPPPPIPPNEPPTQRNRSSPKILQESVTATDLQHPTPPNPPVLPSTSPPPSASLTVNTESSQTIPCPICSMINPRLSTTCQACSHVLDRRKDPKHWTCQSGICSLSSTTTIQYLNPGDCGICGVCGERRK